MYMKSNEPLDDDGTNSYLESALKSLGGSAAMELGTRVIHRVTKNNDYLTIDKIHNLAEQGLYNEKIEQPDAKALLQRMKFSEEKAEKFSHKIADSKFVSFATAGLATTKGRINNYGLGVLGGLAMTAISENNKDDK